MLNRVGISNFVFGLAQDMPSLEPRFEWLRGALSDDLSTTQVPPQLYPTTYNDAYLEGAFFCCSISSIFILTLESR